MVILKWLFTDNGHLLTFRLFLFFQCLFLVKIFHILQSKPFFAIKFSSVFLYSFHFQKMFALVQIQFHVTLSSLFETGLKNCQCLKFLVFFPKLWAAKNWTSLEIQLQSTCFLKALCVIFLLISGWKLFPKLKATLLGNI